MYITDNDKIKKYKTAVLIRRHKTQETPIDTLYLLRGLMNDLDWFGSPIAIVGDGSGTQGDEITTTNKVYELSGATASCDIDVGDNTIVGPSEGDVLIFKCIDKTNVVSVTDDLSVKHTFVDTNDIIVLRKSSTGDWVHAFQSYSGSTSFDTYSYYYTEIGLLEPEPKITVEEDEVKETNKDSIYTEKILFETSDLNVLKSNWEYYRNLTNTNDNLDVCLYDKDNPSETIFLHNMPFDRITGEFGGNKFRLIKLKSEKICDNADDYLSFYPVS